MRFPPRLKPGIRTQDQGWATGPRGFGQIGCIYTAQNFEFDWTGVIIGPDLIWEDGRFTVDRAKTHDGKLKRKAVSDGQVDRLVRHPYHVLLTGARSGIVIYSAHEGTRNALLTLISGTVADSRLAKPKKKMLPPMATMTEQAFTYQLTIEFD